MQHDELQRRVQDLSAQIQDVRIDVKGQELAAGYVLDNLASALDGLVKLVWDQVTGAGTVRYEQVGPPTAWTADRGFDCLIHLPREPYTVVVVRDARWWMHPGSGDRPGRWTLEGTIDPLASPDYWRLKSVDTLEAVYPANGYRAETVQVRSVVESGPAVTHAKRVLQIEAANIPRYTGFGPAGPMGGVAQ